MALPIVRIAPFFISANCPLPSKNADSVEWLLSRRLGMHGGTTLRILYLPTYTRAQEQHKTLSRRRPAVAEPSSDSIGYGITASDALVSGLSGFGVEVEMLEAQPAGDRNAWVLGVLQAFDRSIQSRDFDAVLAFHAMWPFTSDLRRILDEHRLRVPLVTYTHGSHWDETDVYRWSHTPKLAWADLGNLLAADRVLVVSDAFRRTLLGSVSRTSSVAGAELDNALRVAGLPVDIRRLDRVRTEKRQSPLIVFNHAPNNAKRPGVFFQAVEGVLADTDASVLVTRRFSPRTAGADDLARLVARHPARVTLGNDLGIDEYYRALWQAHIQVSTASHESLGVSTLEAMAAEVRPILPDLPAYREITNNAEDVLYATDHDLTERMLTACSDPHGNRTIGIQASRFVRERYSASSVARRVLSVLNEIAHNPIPIPHSPDCDGVVQIDASQVHV